MVDPGLHRSRIGSWTLSSLDSAIVIGHRPGDGLGILPVARNQVEMQMAGTLPKSDRIHPIAPREFLHQLRRPLHHQAPGLSFLSGEGNRTAQMAPGIETTPTEQW